MNAIAVLYAAELNAYAYELVLSDKHALSLALERATAFPGVRRVVLLAAEGDAIHVPESCEIITAHVWTVKLLLETLAAVSTGTDLVYFAWADCPFLDPELAGKIADRHIKYRAEYSYADGWPYGLAPEIIAPDTAVLLAKLIKDRDEAVKRDALFSVIQKDINSFDIETEISPVDLRPHRLYLTADSKRNLLLLQRFAAAGLSGVGDAERIIHTKPALLRTLPAFYAIQVSDTCPQQCSLCPYSRKQETTLPSGEPMHPEVFARVLDAIVAFSGDAVIDLSLWGEIALHPQRLELINAVLARPGLSLVIETAGVGWTVPELQEIADKARGCSPRTNHQPALSWIVSLDAQSEARYRTVRGAGYAEAMTTVSALQRLFPADTYLQAVRVAGEEDDIEQFYRFWKEKGANIIIQKYDDFCGFLPRLQASDLSPVLRLPCWHLMRDMPILLDGTVPLCREDLAGRRVLGNVFTESLETIWERGMPWYILHCTDPGTWNDIETGICARCDEYYTYNF
jgi:spiro-SPASM protein